MWFFYYLGDYMKKNEVVKKSLDFDKVINNGKKVSNNYYTIFYNKMNNTYPHFGLAISKKIGKAHLRNKIKRQLRMLISNNKFLFSNGYYYIIMVKKGYLDISYSEKEKELINLIKKENICKND